MYLNLFCLHVKAPSNETDYLALLKFKESISDDHEEVLSSWNSSNHFCTWTGITCSLKHQRVTELNLRGYHLSGFISPYVGNLSFLRNLFLNDNSFNGEIPPEMGRLFRLRRLSLGNKLTGGIPWNLSSCTELRRLNLSWNSLTGKIPVQLGLLEKLEMLLISKNKLTGIIPSSIWNLSSLQNFEAAHNYLEGNIAEEIGHLKSLRGLNVGTNNLSGSLPSSLYNMSSLTYIVVAMNHLNGTRLPNNMFSTLTNLQIFGIAGNQISSSIPNSITNASSLQIFDIPINYFRGKVPNLWNMKDLSWLDLELNNLGSSSNDDLNFISSLKNCSKLEKLSLAWNKFGGVLPNSIGNLSTQLTQLNLGRNEISGTAPGNLGKCTNLILLNLEFNKFSGNIPTSFGNFHEMQVLTFEGNEFSGEFPISLGNLSRLYLLILSDNMLEGKIPPMIGGMKNLQHLDLSKNNFTGSIPLQIFGLPSLSILLNLSHNSLNGALPIEVGTLKNLNNLDFSENHLSGEIPSTIGECTSMEYLNLQGNSFNGPMPSSLVSLKGLVHLDMSRNNLSGPILASLQDLSFLQYLNVSFNMLEGGVPTKGVFSNNSAVSVMGNMKLCGGISVLHLPQCPVKKNHNLKLTIIIICVAFSILVIFVLALYWWRKRSKKSASASPTIEQLSKMSYQDLHFATEGFSTNNLIGSGSFGTIYKGRLHSEDKIVAIKVLNLQVKGAEKSFISECNALKNIRHRNLVKILTCCSSTNFKGQEFKALVFEFMPNGSLENWLHLNLGTADQCPTLNLGERLNIINDVASTLHYLYHECEQPIVHCDIKPSNILLNDNLVAHLSDFGLARLLSSINGTTFKKTSTTGIKGTIGYVPPEYGISFEISTQGDVYSFGILILEMLTGRKPTDEMFKDGHDLHSYVKAAYPNNLLDIVDSALDQTRTTTGEEIRMDELSLLHHSNHEKTIFSLFEIGLACSVKSHNERLNMMDVTRKLNQISTCCFNKRKG
ncbi:putative receptor-like protein kinase At3g47110 [Prosopis cineraria]|uniref:putative receptor-like protein kinase At3g47110 n=1 Tax=Prosopis cineraria TaxID=364024 RepID=UPI00240FEBEF|nr:putative receptor-like protein kinase At3g47110 [Prosopis cineraria]